MLKALMPHEGSQPTSSNSTTSSQSTRGIVDTEGFNCSKSRCQLVLMGLRKGHHKVGSRVEKKDGTKSKPAMGKKGTIKRSVCLHKYTVR